VHVIVPSVSAKEPAGHNSHNCWPGVMANVPTVFVFKFNIIVFVDIIKSFLILIVFNINSFLIL